MIFSRFLGCAPIFNFIVALLLATVHVAHANPAATKLACASAVGIRTEAEVELVGGQGIYNVNVTFIGKRPSDKEVDRVLRDCLSVAVKHDGSKDMLGSPWFRKRMGDSPYDDVLLNPYGTLRYLFYEASSKRISVREVQLKKKSS